MKKAVLILSGIIAALFIGAMILFKAIEMNIDRESGTSVATSSTHSILSHNNSKKQPETSVSVNDVRISAVTGAENPVPESKLKMEASLTEEDWEQRIDAGLTDSRINYVYNECRGLFAFQSMKESERQLYAEIYILLTEHSPDVFICSLDENKIDYAYNCVLNDHPEIFYVDGYNYTRYSANDVVHKIAFSGRENMDSSEISQYERDIQEYEREFMSGISKSSSEYEKVKYTYQYIIQNTEYDESSPLNQTICSVMSNHRSVCQGYAKTIQYLLEKLDVSCTLITGRTIGGENHAWNLVRVNGAYYYLDATWGDSSYQADGQSDGKLGEITYDYLLITTSELQKNLIIDNVVPAPACISTENNYYVKEELYFQDYDVEKLARAFQKARAAGLHVVSIKCSNSLVFDSFFDTLIENQAIFDFIPEDSDSINYTYNENFNTLTFFF